MASCGLPELLLVDLGHLRQQCFLAVRVAT